LLAALGNSGVQIRRILQVQYEAGALRKETFELVKSMLDRYVTENIPTNVATKSIELSKIPQPANEAPVSAPQPSAPLTLGHEVDTDTQFGAPAGAPGAGCQAGGPRNLRCGSRQFAGLVQEIR